MIYNKNSLLCQACEKIKELKEENDKLKFVLKKTLYEAIHVHQVYTNNSKAVIDNYFKDAIELVGK